MHIIKSTASVPTKFCTVINTAKYFLWVVQTCTKQIYMGGGHHLEKSKNCHISATV